MLRFGLYLFPSIGSRLFYCTERATLSPTAVTPDQFSTFGELLRHLRRQARITQRELAIAVGYSDTQISRLEQNQRVPDAATITALFVPALYIEQEPKWVARLQELAKAARVGGVFVPENIPIPTTPNNLPIQLTSFIGREKELADVKELLHNAPLLMLLGPGGTGKTRISIQAASELLDQYPSGVWFVELAPILDPLLVPRTTAIAIGLRDEPQRPVIDMLCDYLREKKILIILDNCEHLVYACAQMADRLLHAAPRARILASSREALGIAGEVTYQVPSLGLPDLGHLPSIESLSQYEAVRLFIDRATAAVSTFTVTNDNAPALAQICHRLDGIPLAIELAAAKIRVLSLDQIAKRLDDRFRLLTGGSRTALERHQTLRAAIDWSYNLLSPAEQTLFRRLSVFLNGWTLEAAESVCGDPSTLRHGERETNRQDDASLKAGSGLVPSGDDIRSDDVLNLLEHLINKSLVVAEEMGHESRYRMLETMRQYANEKLVEAGACDALRDRHLEYFLQFAEAAAPHLIRTEQLEWLAQLDADYENLRLALERALNKETAEPSLRLCAALGKFWYIRAYWQEGSKWLKSALSKTTLSPNAAEKTARVKALYRDAELANMLDDLERMKLSAELGLVLAQEGSNKGDIAIARFFVGFVSYRYGDNDRARELMEWSLFEFSELNDPYWESYSYRWLGNILVREGKLKFSEMSNQNLKLARKAGERLNLAEVILDYAYMIYVFDGVNKARKCVEEADMLVKQIGSNYIYTSSLFAELAWLDGDYKKARAFYMEMQEHNSLLGDKEIRSAIITKLGRLAREEGNLDQAQAYLEEALAAARELEHNRDIMHGLVELGNTFYLQGYIEKFKQNFIEGIHLAKGRSRIAKSRFLVIMLYSICIENPENSARLLGAIHSSCSEMDDRISPLIKRIYYDRAETHARKALGDAAFESAFAEGQKMSVDEALDLALKTVEEM